MQRPRILVTLDHTYKPVERLFINLAYLRAIERAGGEPVLIARPDEKTIIHMIESAHGILLSGGDDVAPPSYGQEPRSCLGKCDPTGRDQVEFLIIRHARTKQLPILGICRGMQMLNVVLGGTLHQDVMHEMPKAQKHDYHKNEDSATPLGRSHLAHEVRFEPASLLHSLVGVDKIKVNSLHHQGVEQLGTGLRAVAYAPDGLIEGVELPEYPFLLGVQWHPEELSDEGSQNIFRAFVKAATERRDASTFSPASVQEVV